MPKRTLEQMSSDITNRLRKLESLLAERYRQAPVPFTTTFGERTYSLRPSTGGADPARLWVKDGPHATEELLVFARLSLRVDFLLRAPEFVESLLEDTDHILRKADSAAEACDRAFEMLGR